MVWNAKNGCVSVGGTEMYYVSFGRGEKTLVVLPGLSDGLATVKGKALVLARPFQPLFHQYTVYMFSRKNVLPEGYSIRDMAADQAAAMEALGLEKASVLGVSQGGMIALCLAIDAPEMVERLVVAVSASRANDTIRECVSRWVELAERGDHKRLMIDTAEKSYSDAYLKKYRKIYPLLGWIGKPADYHRFFVNARAILGFDVHEELGKIACPTLILAGEEDKTVSARASYEMRDKIAGSQLYVYPGLGHAAYEEAPDFYERVFRFLETKERGAGT